jgi:exodeoxyribonuclease VII small subunit
MDTVSKKPDPTQESSLTSEEEAALSFEEALERVESIIERIESGEAGLERSIDEYERGMRLIRRCRSILDAAEQKVEEISAKLLDESAGDEEPAP